MKEHLIAIKWDPTTPPHAFLHLRDLEKKPDEVYKKPISPGEPFHMTLSRDKVCIGHSVNKQEYYLCNLVVTEQYSRCYSCEQKDFQKCFMFCDASKPFGNCAQIPEAYEYCKNHRSSVYLALIANDVKVGVSFNPFNRWINQGADVAVEVFRARNGFEARSLEKKISSDLQISQTIRKTTKARKLNFDLSKSLQGFRDIVAVTLSYLEENSYNSEESELLHKETELSSFYGNIPSLTVNPIFNEIEKTFQVTGDIVGIKGKLLVTQINSSYYVTNLTKAIGHQLTFSSTPLKMKGQKSLSEYF